MKRFLLSVAILAVAASCSKNEVVDIPQTDVIGFSSLNDNVTKVANDVTDGVAYQVYAMHSSTDAADWYINDVVSAAEVAAAGPYYWPSSGTLTFYAYAPATAAADIVDTYSTAATSGVTFTYQVPDGAQEDFTMSSITTGQSTGTAKFTFAHKLAKVNVAVVLDTDFATAHSLVDDYTASVTVLQDEATGEVLSSTLTPATDGATAIKYEEEVRTYYIMPQIVNGCSVEVDGITVNNTSTSLPVFDGVDLAAIALDSAADGGNVAFSSFEAGKEYTFTITVTASAATEDEDDQLEIIKFEATNGSWTSVAQPLAQPEDE